MLYNVSYVVFVGIRMLMTLYCITLCHITLYHIVLHYVVFYVSILYELSI